MAAYFFDSSALVKRYVVESGTQWVRNLCNPTAGHSLYLVRITGAEVIAALARRTRAGSLAPSTAQRVMAAFRSDFVSAYFVSELTFALVDRAMDLVQIYGLRGYDAVQLAAAVDVNAERHRYSLLPVTLISADSDLNQAAAAEGLAVENPIELIAGTLPRRQQRLVEAWAELHQAELLADWQRLQGGQKAQPIEPLK